MTWGVGLCHPHCFRQASSLAYMLLEIVFLLPPISLGECQDCRQEYTVSGFYVGYGDSVSRFSNCVVNALPTELPLESLQSYFDHRQLENFVSEAVFKKIITFLLFRS